MESTQPITLKENLKLEEIPQEWMVGDVM